MNKRIKKKIKKRFPQTILTDNNGDVYIVTRDTYRHNSIVKAVLLKNVYPVAIDTPNGGHCINGDTIITFKSSQSENNNVNKSASELREKMAEWFKGIS